MPNDPRWPSVMSFRYISKISSLDARVVMMSDTHASSSLRRHDFSRASLSVMPGNIFGRNTLRAICCVMVLAPAVYLFFPRMFEIAAPTMPMGSTPGCS